MKDTTIRTSQSTRDKLKELAEKEKRSMNKQLEVIVNKFLQENKEQK